MKQGWNGVCINVDFDGVIADLAAAIIILKGGPPPYVDDITYWKHPLFRDVRAVISDPKVYEYIYPLPQAAEAMKGLYSSGYYMRIVTDCPEQAREYRENWLQSWGIPFDELLITANKNEAGGDFLIDDKPDNVQRYADNVGPAILFGQPWNRNDALFVTQHPAERYTSWGGAVEQIRRWIKEGRMLYKAVEV